MKILSKKNIGNQIVFDCSNISTYLKKHRFFLLLKDSSLYTSSTLRWSLDLTSANFYYLQRPIFDYIIMNLMNNDLVSRGSRAYFSFINLVNLEHLFWWNFFCNVN